MNTRFHHWQTGVNEDIRPEQGFGDEVIFYFFTNKHITHLLGSVRETPVCKTT